MPILTRLAQSMPASVSRKPCTKCWRDISPSLTMSMPISSCSLSVRMVASRLASARASPWSAQGAHSILGLASQAGLGRLPARVVSSMAFLPGGDFLHGGDEARHGLERGAFLVAMGRVPTPGQHQPLEAAFHLALDGAELLERAVLVVGALDRQHRTGHAGQEFLDVPAAEFGRQPDVVPAAEHVVDVV